MDDDLMTVPVGFLRIFPRRRQEGHDRNRQRDREIEDFLGPLHVVAQVIDHDCKFIVMGGKGKDVLPRQTAVRCTSLLKDKQGFHFSSLLFL